MPNNPKRTTTAKFKALREFSSTQARPKILVVEDDVGNAKIIERVLKTDFDVKVAHDGIVASTMLQDESFDIILSDIILPGISGIELLRLIRTYDLDVPVLLMTGAPELKGVIQAVELGAAGYLLKPFAFEELREKLARALTIRKLLLAKQRAYDVLPPAAPRVSAAMGVDRAGLGVLLDRALAGLTLAFQPIVDVDRKAIVAYEALMRASDPMLGTPGDILDVAERLKRTGDVTRKVATLAAESMTKLPEGADLYVNIHSRDLVQGDLAVSSPLVQHAKRVVLEITERASLDAVTHLPERIRALREVGYRVAIDDLGAGYAGLSTFAMVEPEIVKIDMSLVRGVDSMIVKQRVVSAIVKLSRELSMHVVAEGVETMQELACVVELGCDLVQGYYLGRPTPEFVATFTGW